MLANFLAGLSDGYTDQQNRDKDRLVNDEMKKLKIKVFKHELEQKDQAEQAKKGLIDLISNFIPQDAKQGTTLPVNQAGPTRPMPQGHPADLRTVLQSPEGQGLALKAGYAPNDLKNFTQPTITDILSQINGSGGTGGLEVSGVKFDTQGHPMIDFERPKAGKEVSDPSGKGFIQLDQFGRPIGSRGAAPGEVSRSPGQNAIDKSFADEYVTFRTLGGFASVKKNLDQLETVLEDLKTKKLTGPAIGVMPDSVLQLTNPDAIKAREYVQEAVQSSLRQVLGAQFTENEGNRLMARAFNPSLSPKENSDRVSRLIKMIKTAAESKQEAADYFEKNNGSLEGFKGKAWSMADFMNSLDTKPSLDIGKKKNDPLGIR